MPASYPGTYKVFNAKVDLIDTVFAAHINDLQVEQVAVETTLGINPQGSSATVGDRISVIESGYVSRNRVESVTGVKTFSDEIVGSSGAVLTDHVLVKNSAVNIRVDSQGIRALKPSDSSVLDLALQPGSGKVLINGQTAWHAGNDGAGSGLDADLLDGHSSTYFSPTTHAHFFIGFWNGLPDGNGYVDANYLPAFASIGYTPRFVATTVTFPTSGVTYVPRLIGMPSITDTYFRTRWMNQIDGNPFLGAMTFYYAALT